MGRPKGIKSSYTFRTEMEKFKIIEPILNGQISSHQVSKENNISSGLISAWIKAYRKTGMEGLKNHTKPGNPIAKLFVSKHLTEEEKLRLENMKLRIENERLKKGYTSEEADRAKKQLGKNMK